MEVIKTLELFGGIGAPRSALENLGLNIKAIDYVEILSNAVKAYNAMYDLSYSPQDVLNWNLNVDLLVHGSPCQDFSVAGLNDITTGRSILYQRTLEIIEKELHPRPKYVLWENVKGLISKRNYVHYDHYISEMERMGYKSYMKILEAKEFGIPQTRPRVFTISIRNDIHQTFDFDVLNRKELIPLKEFLDFPNDSPNVTLDINQPSMIKAIESGKVAILVNKSATVTCKNVRWNNVGVCFKDKTFYEQDLSMYDFSLSDLEGIKKAFPKYFENKESLADVFRYLTPKECWALQGYSMSQYDKVKATGISDYDMYKLAGNSICVPVLEAIFKELLVDKKSNSSKYVVNSNPKFETNLFGETLDVERYQSICKKN